LKRSNRLVLLIGIFLAIIVFALIVFALPQQQPNSGGPTPPPTTAKLVVAATDIDLGATITGDMVTLKEIPLTAKPAGVQTFEDTSVVIGSVARAQVTSGQLITSITLGTTAGGAITDLKVPAGFVAMAVQVDQVSGVGTIIKAGDFVDVISGFTGADKVPLVIANPVASPAPQPDFINEPLTYNATTVKVLSQGLQVLGTLLPPPPQAAAAQPATSAPPTTGGTPTTLNGQQQIVILAVPAQDAEVIKFSQMDGSISLVLRSSTDCTTKPAEGQTYCPVVATTGITLRRLVEDRGVLPPQVVQVVDPTPLPGTKPKK